MLHRMFVNPFFARKTPVFFVRIGIIVIFAAERKGYKSYNISYNTTHSPGRHDRIIYNLLLF